MLFICNLHSAEIIKRWIFTGVPRESLKSVRNILKSTGEEEFYTMAAFNELVANIFRRYTNVYGCTQHAARLCPKLNSQAAAVYFFQSTRVRKKKPELISPEIPRRVIVNERAEYMDLLLPLCETWYLFITWLWYQTWEIICSNPRWQCILSPNTFSKANFSRNIYFTSNI